MSERFLQAASSGETAVVASMLRNPGRAPDEVAAQLAACSAGVLGGGGASSSSSSMLPPDLFPTTQAVNVRLSVGTSALVSTVGPEDGQDLSLPPTKGRGRSREDFVPDGI